VPPITIKGSSIAAGRLLTKRWVLVAGSPQPGKVQMAVSLATESASASSSGMAPKGRPAKSVSRPEMITS
jgi:hypothetical protein